MDLQALLDTIPEIYHWQLHQPPTGYKGQVKQGKKWKDVRYSFHVSNGPLFFTKHYASVVVDGDNMVEIIQQALVLLAEKVEKQKKDEEDEKRRASKSKDRRTP
jgi:hypothetical protein